MSNRLLTLVCATAIVAIAACSTSVKLPDGVPATAFVEVNGDFEHHWDGKIAHPFVGSAVIDTNADGRYEVFVGGGKGQSDRLLSYQDGALINTIDDTGLSRQEASYGAAAADINNDGLVDLIVCRDGAVWLHVNQGGNFSAQKLALNFPEDRTPLAVTLSDIDHDGDLDLYISTFVHATQFKSATFNDSAHAKANHLMRNDGELQFTDITDASGTAGSQNTFLSVFTDLDGDRYQDLVVANNTGMVEIFRNNKDTTFSPIELSSGLGYWMGIGVGDFDNDGDQDLLFSNVSDTIPSGLLTGDLRKEQGLNQEWLMLRNDGRMAFTDATQAMGLSEQGFGWGAVFEDLNLDGSLDLLVAQSYIKWPIHKFAPLKGRAMLQVATDTGRQFINAPQLALRDAHYGQTPLIVDLDNDGRQDVVWVNMNGPVLARLNRHKSKAVTVDLLKNAQWLGAKVTAIYENGRSFTRELNSGVGMQSDQSPQLAFAQSIHGGLKSIEIQMPDGGLKRIDGPFTQAVIQLR